MEKSSRRSFIGKTLAITSTLALTSLAFKPMEQDYTTEEGLFIIGPKKEILTFNWNLSIHVRIHDKPSKANNSGFIY